MKNILFIAAGDFGFGETTLALNFMNRLSKEKFTACFILAKSHEMLITNKFSFPYTMFYPTATALNKLLFKNLTLKYPPSLIILSDIFTFIDNEWSTGVTWDDLCNLHCPIASIDIYDVKSTNFKLDMMNGVIKNVPYLINDLDFLIKPCPINNPLSGSPESMFSTIDKIDTSRNHEKVRQQFGIPKETFIIFTAHGFWEELIIKLDRKRKWNFYSVIPELVKSHVIKMENIFWINVTPNVQEGLIKIPNGCIYNISQIPEKQYDFLLSGTDLFITTNLISNTLWKSISMNVPSLLLHNSYSANSIEELRENTNFNITSSVKNILNNSFPAKPYWVFPIGLRSFLNHIVIDNPYMDTFQMAEIFDEQSMLMKSQNASDKNYKKELNIIVQKYFDKLQFLPTPDLLIECICSK